MKPDRVTKCRSCGLQIAVFNEQQTIAHEDPECAWFQELCSTADHEEVIVLQQPIALETEPQSAPNN